MATLPGMCSGLTSLPRSLTTWKWTDHQLQVKQLQVEPKGSGAIDVKEVSLIRMAMSELEPRKDALQSALQLLSGKRKEMMTASML
jgi:hypothetical protein